MRCFFCRWSISRAADDGREPSPRARRHLEGCAACASFAARVEALGESLSAGRAEAPRPQTDALTQSRKRRAWAVAMTAAAAAGGLALYSGIDRNHPLSPEPLEVPVVAETAAADLDVDALASDAEQGLRYVLRVSGLPER